METTACSFCGADDGRRMFTEPGVRICLTCARIAASGIAGFEIATAPPTHVEAILWRLLRQADEYVVAAERWHEQGLSRLACEAEDMTDTVVAAARVLASYRGWSVARDDELLVKQSMRADEQDWSELEKLRKAAEGES